MCGSFLTCCLLQLGYSDVDHPGIGNAQLDEEDPDLVLLYKNHCVAEQKSFDIAWDVLMDKKYLELRSCIYTDENEFKRFRELAVNCVVATDLFDEDMKKARLERWNGLLAQGTEDMALGGKEAMLMIELIVQASDIAHTMQHWNVFCKWNERLFQEKMTAYQAGREDKDPTTFWYEEELKFFDEYAIPLARRLQEFQVFGVASNECLAYAMDNRAEWVLKGKDIVSELTVNFETGSSAFWQSRPSGNDWNESGSTIILLKT